MNGIRFIPTSVHGVIDYIEGVLLILASWIFGFWYVGGAPVIVPIVLGIDVILYSLLTRYELGIPGIRFLPMPFHLVIDFVAGAFLALSPWIFGFANRPLNAWLPHLIVGLGTILVVVFTQTQPRTKVANTTV